MESIWDDLKQVQTAETPQPNKKRRPEGVDFRDRDIFKDGLPRLMTQTMAEPSESFVPHGAFEHKEFGILSEESFQSVLQNALCGTLFKQKGSCHGQEKQELLRMFKMF